MSWHKEENNIGSLRAAPATEATLYIATLLTGSLCTFPDIHIMAGEVVAGNELVFVTALAVDILLYD